MKKKIYENRFAIFLITQLAILFGSLFFSHDFFEYTLQPILFLLNIVAGILLLSKQKTIMWFFIVLFVISAFVFGSSMINRTQDSGTVLFRLCIYFAFHIVVTASLIQQIWKSKSVNKNVIFGLMSGYISLGFLAFSYYVILLMGI